MVVLNDVDTHQLAKSVASAQAGSDPGELRVTDLALAGVSERELAVIESSAPSLAERMVRERWKEQAIELLQGPDDAPIDYPQIDEAQTEGYSFANFIGPDQEQALNSSSN